jgi:hypothetical protein
MTEYSSFDLECWGNRELISLIIALQRENQQLKQIVMHNDKIER